MILEKNMSDVILDINIADTGLFILPDDSSTGKTYLTKLLSHLDSNDVLVVTYDKDKDIMNLKLNKALNSDTVKLICMDRADLYITNDLLNQIQNKAKNCTILIDLKNYESYKVYIKGVACILLTEERLSLF